ncbi:MAG: glycosyltransferase family 4 protein [Chloroflexi bacterium]|nr:glycosyltransferase family 4 protein [Chloroflexota bacterium]
MAYTILSIASTSFFADYGAHVRIWEETRALQKLGHRIVIATYHNGDNMPGFEIRRSWDVPWVKRTMVGASHHKMYLDVALSWRALRVAMEIKPDLIHAHIHESALIGSVLSRMFKVPLVFDYQGSLTAEMLDHGFLKRDGMFYKPFHWLENKINRTADAVLTSSFNAANMLRDDWKFPAERLYTVPDSVNTDRFRPFDGSAEWHAERERIRSELGIPSGRKIVAYLGLLAAYQGTNVLLEAAQIIRQQRDDVHFLIMGYPDVRSYLALAESLGVADIVTMPGRILYKDAHAYLALGDVAVAPKMSATEGAGKIPNYMAVGLPVITFDTPVSHEILGDAGVYAKFGDAQSLADEILGLIDNPERRHNLAQTVRTRAVNEHSWELAARQIEAIYERVLAKRAGNPLPEFPTSLQREQGS